MAEAQLYQFANYFGIIRRDAVFSTIDVRHIDNSAGTCCDALDLHCAKLRLPDDFNKSCQLGDTVTLVEVTTDCQFKIPAGSVIHQVVVVNRNCEPCENLDPDLSFVLGYLSDECENNAVLTSLAQRIADSTHPITGLLLNQRPVLHIDQRLYADELAEQNDLYNAEALANGDVLIPINYDIVNGLNYVSETKNLYPAITITAGSVRACELDFCFQFTPPPKCNPKCQKANCCSRGFRE